MNRDLTWNCDELEWTRIRKHNRELHRHTSQAIKLTIYEEEEEPGLFPQQEGHGKLPLPLQAGHVVGLLESSNENIFWLMVPRALHRAQGILVTPPHSIHNFKSLQFQVTQRKQNPHTKSIIFQKPIPRISFVTVANKKEHPSEQPFVADEDPNGWGGRSEIHGTLLLFQITLSSYCNSRKI